ncbi:hypothetical protein F5Y12DRAFT_162116 [Xylaria sp. FL1777]|nr:hypothetical protein F5Y12DRAFT_162116 [Xylaria sp. FL1777]
MMLDRLPRQDISNSQGSLMLFTDTCCQDAISKSSLPLISGDCQGAPFAGIRSVVLTSLPTCPDYGLPLLIVSNETSCKNPQSESSANSGVIGKCQSFVVNEISSFQFICYGKGISSAPPPPTTTSTTTWWQWQSTPSTTAWFQSETQWTPTSTWGWDGSQSETQWTPTSTWDWGGEYGPTLTIISNEKELMELDADGRSWTTLTITVNDAVYEVRQPIAEHDVDGEDSLICSSGDMVSQRHGAPVLAFLVTIWLLVSLL